MRNLYAKDFNFEVVKNELSDFRRRQESLKYLPSEYEVIKAALVSAC